MGLYDYINGESVKCFYTPVINNEKYYLLNEPEKEPYTFQTGGSLKNYGVGEVVPYVTTYYDFTPNFLVVDPSGEKIHVIEDGKVKGTISYTYREITKEIFTGKKIINYCGVELKIESRKDLIQFKKDHDTYYKRVIAIRNKYKVDFRDRSLKSRVLIEEYFRVLEEVKSGHINKWVDSKNKDIYELGELLYCWIYYYKRRGCKDIDDQQGLKLCEDYLEKCLDESPGILGRYLSSEMNMCFHENDRELIKHRVFKTIEKGA